jgi:hypothetical protein
VNRPDFVEASIPGRMQPCQEIPGRFNFTSLQGSARTSKAVPKLGKRDEVEARLALEKPGKVAARPTSLERLILALA